VLDIVLGWGSDFIVTKSRKVYPAQLPGVVATDASGKKLGLISYEIRRDSCEIVLFEVFRQHCGIGTKLLSALKRAARRAGCRRIWLLTTNDNLDALRFYQRRNFVISAVNCDAIKESRKMKQAIPRIGNFGIPIRDEIELEMELK